MANPVALRGWDAANRGSRPKETPTGSPSQTVGVERVSHRPLIAALQAVLGATELHASLGKGLRPSIGRKVLPRSKALHQIGRRPLTATEVRGPRNISR